MLNINCFDTFTDTVYKLNCYQAYPNTCGFLLPSLLHLDNKVKDSLIEDPWSTCISFTFSKVAKSFFLRSEHS